LGVSDYHFPAVFIFIPNEEVLLVMEMESQKAEFIRIYSILTQMFDFFHAELTKELESLQVIV